MADKVEEFLLSKKLDINEKSPEQRVKNYLFSLLEPEQKEKLIKYFSTDHHWKNDVDKYSMHSKITLYAGIGE